MPGEKKYCAKCGCEVKSYAYGSYCDDCAEGVWDSGFASSSEHAYEIGFHECVLQLAAGGRQAEEAVREIMVEWGPLAWECVTCKKTILTKKRSAELDFEEKVKLVLQKCPCGGKVKPMPPDTFYR